MTLNFVPVNAFRNLGTIAVASVELVAPMRSSVLRAPAMSVAGAVCQTTQVLVSGLVLPSQTSSSGLNLTAVVADAARR